MSSTFRDCISKNNTVTRENGFGCYDSKKVLNLTEDGETRFVKNLMLSAFRSCNPSEKSCHLKSTILLL